MGGTGLYVDALSRALGAAGHTVGVVAPDRGLLPRIIETQADGLEGWRLITPPSLSWAGGWSRTSGLGVWRDLIRTWRPDVVHVHHLSGLPMGLLRTARDLGVHTVMTLHDYALPCARGQLVDRHLAPCPGPEPTRCAPCVFGPSAAGGIRGRRAQQRIRRRMEAAREAMDAADQLLSPSTDLAQRMERFGLRRPDRYALPILRPPAPLVEPANGPVRFLFASALIPTKGPDRVLDAFEQLPAGPTLTVAGPAMPYDGDTVYGRDLAARGRAMTGVTWAGSVPPDGVPALLARHDVLVLPSIWPENSPLIVREAVAAGLRVIAGAEGGVAEFAPHATLVGPTDDAALLTAMKTEVTRGRGRAAPIPSQTPAQHAVWLVENVYRADDRAQLG
jgi:glycosyltransferase involved in cell wall biosynthesis